MANIRLKLISEITDLSELAFEINFAHYCLFIELLVLFLLLEIENNEKLFYKIRKSLILIAP